MDKLNGLLKNIEVKDVPKSQWKILQSKNGIDSEAAKMNTAKFDTLNQTALKYTRSLGGFRTSNSEENEPSFTGAKAMLKNKYLADFWKIKDPSRIAITPKIKDPLGYEDSTTINSEASEINDNTDVYYDGSKKLNNKQNPKDNFICFLPIVKKLYNSKEPLENVPGCNIDYLKLQKDRMNKDLNGLIEEDKETGMFKSMDPNDYPNDTSAKPKNYIQHN